MELSLLQYRPIEKIKGTSFVSGFNKTCRVGTKLGLVGAAVYYSAEYGVWKDSSKTEQLYKDIYTVVAPLFKDVPIETPEIPKASEISLYTKTCWNHGVVNTANFITNLPQHTKNLCNKGYDWVLEQFSEVKPKEL